MNEQPESWKDLKWIEPESRFLMRSLFRRDLTVMTESSPVPARPAHGAGFSMRYLVPLEGARGTFPSRNRTASPGSWACPWQSRGHPALIAPPGTDRMGG